MQEAELVSLRKQELKKNDRFALLVEEYKTKIYSIVRKMVINHHDADDVVQEVFIKVWTNLDKFKGNSDLFTWIYRIATNESLQFLRKKRKHLWFQDLNSLLTDQVKSDSYLDGDEVQKKLQQAILQLPDKQRMVFHLKYYEELKYEQIAKITDSSIGSLKASYHHATKKIEKYLQSD